LELYIIQILIELLHVLRVQNILVLVKLLVEDYLSECAGAVDVVEGVVGISV
jgi:hypothetical protein